MKISKKNLLILCVSCAIVASSAIAIPLILTSKKTVKIACVGDSITYGYGVEETKDAESYPAYLQALIGNKYEITNYGNIGSTALEKGNKPFVKQKEYTASIEKKADIYIVMLGTNDSKPINWNHTNNGKTFKKDLKNLLTTYKQLESKPKVIAMKPPKSFRDASVNERNPDDKVIKTSVSTIIQEVGNTLDVPVLDLYPLTKNHPEWFPDELHPNAEGNKAIADYIFKEIKSLIVI